MTCFEIIAYHKAVADVLEYIYGSIECFASNERMYRERASTERIYEEFAEEQRQLKVGYELLLFRYCCVEKVVNSVDEEAYRNNESDDELPY